MDVSFTELLAAVRTGEPAFPKIFGRPVWEDLEDHPDLANSFGALMASRAASFAADVVNCYDWNGITQVVDVGGGSGQVLTRLIQPYPAMNGTLVDLPAIASLAQSTFDAAGIANRASAVEGNIFDTLPAGGQLYLLASILRDWNDHEAIAVLRRCAEAAGIGHRILVVDRTSEHGNSLTFTFMNLLMLVFLGGKERTIVEFAELGQAAGLRACLTWIMGGFHP
jgi:hypothetical protein